MKPLRVLMVVRLFDPWVGGTEVQAHRLAKKLRERHVDVEIATGWWFRGTPQRDVLDGVPIFRNQTLWEMFGIKGLRKFGGYLYMCSLLWYLWRQRADYDIIHIHGLNYHTAVAVLAGRWFDRRTLVKLANSGRASDIGKMRGNQQLALTQYLLPVALGGDRFVATNKMIVQELAAVGVPTKKIVRLPNGVEVDSIPAKSSYALHDPIRLVFVGRLHEQKGLDVLLKAFQRLRERRPALAMRLQLLGEGPLRHRVIDLSAELGIAAHVDVVGQTKHVFEHMRQADVFILPSRAEGISNALLEAMACGAPVVASNIPGNVDVVEHEQNGLLFAVDDPGALAEAVASLLDRPELRGLLGRAARQTVERQYGLGFVADRYVALYQDLLLPESRATALCSDAGSGQSNPKRNVNLFDDRR